MKRRKGRRADPTWQPEPEFDPAFGASHKAPGKLQPPLIVDGDGWGYYRGWSEWGVVTGLAFLLGGAALTLFVVFLVLWSARADWVLMLVPSGLLAAGGVLFGVSLRFLRKRAR